MAAPYRRQMSAPAAPVPLSILTSVNHRRCPTDPVRWRRSGRDKSGAGGSWSGAPWRAAARQCRPLGYHWWPEKKHISVYTFFTLKLLQLSRLLAAFSWWFAHPCLALGGVQLPLPVLQWSWWTERTQIKKKTTTVLQREFKSKQGNSTLKQKDVKINQREFKLKRWDFKFKQREFKLK